MAQSALQWVVIAYGLLLGGFLLLGGRLGDLLGRRRIFLVGLALFSGASLLAGVSQSSDLLIGARALQGFGIGVLLILLAARFLPADRREAASRHFDALGATTVTGGLLLLVYGLNRGVDHGWTSASTLALFVGALALLATFVRVESRSRSPLVPGASLRNRTMVAADLAPFLLFGSFFAFIFLATLLMQQLLLYSPTRTGVAWLATSITAFIAAGVAGARLVSLVGVKRLLVVGMTFLALGLVWLIRVPPGAEYLTDLLPAFILVGTAIGLSAPSVQIGALSGVAGPAVGLASGLVETMREIGGAVGIAAVSTVLVARTRDMVEIAGPAAREAAAFEGFQSAFVVTVVLAALGALVASIAFPRAARGVRVPSGDEADVEPEPATPLVLGGASVGLEITDFPLEPEAEEVI